MRLCTRCAEKERKENSGRQDGPGLWSFPMPRLSRCDSCKSQAYGFEICAGCAVEKGHCQGCYTRIAASEILLSEIADHRRALKSAKEAAEKLYAQTIEPYKLEAARYEEGIAASELQRNADCQPFWDAASVAEEKWRRFSPHASEAERAAASKAYLDAKWASDDNSQAQFEHERQRNQALRKEFAQYEQYRRAVKLRDRSNERAVATFEAAVERSIEIAEAEVIRQIAVDKANERYKRSIEMQDALDRILTAL